MAKDKEIENVNAEVTVNAADLLKLFAALQAQSSKENAEVLSDAFAKLSPNYKSPEQKAFEVELRAKQKGIEIAKLRNKKRRERLCEHEQGQTGTDRNGKGAFNMLKLPTGEAIGVCTYCQMTISSANPDHLKFFRKASGTMAESGQLTQYITDPIKAQLARLGEDERKRVMAAREAYKETNPEIDDLDDEII